jgi:hypothetical protein
LLGIARVAARYPQASTLKALLKGMATLGKLAGGGVQEAQQALQILADGKNAELRRAARGQLQQQKLPLASSPASVGSKPATQRPQLVKDKPQQQVPQQVPQQPPVHRAAISLPPLQTPQPPPLPSAQQQAADQARRLEQISQQQQTQFIAELQRQDRRNQLANHAILRGWVQTESAAQLTARVQDMQKVLRGPGTGNVYAHHGYANGKKPPQANNPDFNQYIYGGALLKGRDLKYLIKSLQSFLAQRGKALAQVPPTTAPKPGAVVERPKPDLVGQAARKREAELTESGRKEASEILKNLKPAPLSNQSFEQLLDEAIANARNPYTAFWLAVLGQTVKPGPTSPAAGNMAAGVSSADVNRWNQQPHDNSTSKEVLVAIGRSRTPDELGDLLARLHPTIVSGAAVQAGLASRVSQTNSVSDLSAWLQALPAAVQTLPAVRGPVTARLAQLQDALRGGATWDGQAHAAATFELLTRTAVGAADQALAGSLEKLSRRPDLVRYVLSNKRRFMTVANAVKTLQGMNLVFDSRPADRLGTNRPQRYLGGDGGPFSFPEALRPVVDAYLDNQVVQGSDGKAHVYGRSVKHLDISGQTAEQIDTALKGKGFVRIDDEIRDFKTGQPLGVPMTVYVHPDGGMVRVKPQGDPASPMRKQPHASKSVRWPPDASYAEFEREAVKIDQAGNPRPKLPAHLHASPQGTGKADRWGYVDYFMDNVHTDLPLRASETPVPP